MLSELPLIIPNSTPSCSWWPLSLVDVTGLVNESPCSRSLLLGLLIVQLLWVLLKLTPRVKLGAGGLTPLLRVWPESSSDSPCRAGSLGSAPAVFIVPYASLPAASLFDTLTTGRHLHVVLLY